MPTKAPKRFKCEVCERWFPAEQMVIDDILGRHECRACNEFLNPKDLDY